MGWTLALLRIFIGFKLLLAGIEMWDWIGTRRLGDLLRVWAKDVPVERYTEFLTRIVIPQAALFTYLVVFGEICVGILLIIGLCTRLSALVALFMNTNFLLATWSRGSASQSLNETFLIVELALLLAGAGRTCGLDARLARDRSGWIFW